MSIEIHPWERKPASVIAAIKHGRCSEWLQIDVSVRDFKAGVGEHERDRVDVRSILALPPALDLWRVKICDEGVYLMGPGGARIEQEIALHSEVLPGLPPDALNDLGGE